MKMHPAPLILLACIALGVTSAALAQSAEQAPMQSQTQPRVTREEVVAIVKKAIAQYKRDGKDKTFKAIMDPNGAYRDRELYIWVADFNTGYTVAHGINPRLMGKDLTYIRDPDGKAFFLELSALAKAGKSGWFSYKWPNPINNQIEAKTSYVEPWDGYAFCAGYYPPGEGK